MELLLYIIAAAVASGLLVFIFMKFVFKSTKNTNYDEIEQVKKEKDEAIAALELKIHKVQQDHESVSSELASSKEQLNNLQQQLMKALEGKVDQDALAQIADSSSLRGKIAKLEKKIKDLEDEVEEYEDEIDDLKKNLTRKKNEVEELDEQLRGVKKKNKELEEEVSVKSTELSATQLTLVNREEALSFIKEVLQADKASDGRELELAIDRFTDFIRGELSDVLKETSKKVRIDDSLLRNWALSAKKTWLKNKTTIAFVGEFSAGKTSIVNRILSQDDENIPLLPVSAKATTAIPTYISGGVSTVYQFYSPDNILKSISEGTFKRVTKEVLEQVEGLSSLITYFVMKYKNPNLDRLSILDTPGFNSNDSEDSRRTVEVINECDALFWVFDVNAGTINRSSLKIIKEHLTKPLYIVINKVDTKSDKEVDSVEALIKSTIEAEGIGVKGYIRFSSNPKYSLDSIMEPIRSVSRDTSRDEYIEEVEQCIRNLEKELEEKVKISTSTHTNLRRKHEGVVDRYVNAHNQMFHACERAVNIPHFETHVFRKDNYEMSEQEYNQLYNILNDIATTKSQGLAELFDESNQIVDEMSDSYNRKVEDEQSLRKLKNIIDKFSKYNLAYKKAMGISNSKI